ncbi:signal transduction histidine kinase [Pedobacter africanus]|uniref:Signal transduction histidine kinase n=1 Tax=Pedobacter africanus TaxID=151894 RepID=A0ACC6KQY1_9SPHI|nr:PAS domain-containing protein [Pedobacter africanus]MDR6781611.1 signal transduction histidine kinase [Pedobacter africanus]
MDLNKRRGISPEMLRVFETLPGMYLVLSRELVILTASDLYLQAMGKTLEAIRGRYIFDAFPIDEKKENSFRLRSALLDVVQSKKPVQLPVARFDVPDPENKSVKTERYWHTLNTPVLNDAGDIRYIIHSTNEVTQQVMAEKKLSIHLQKQKTATLQVTQLNKRLEKLFADLPARIAVLSGPRLVYEYTNPSYHEHFGYRDLLGKPLIEALPELREHPIADELRKVYQTGITYEAKELCIPLQNIEAQPPVDHYFNFLCQARLDEHGEINGVISFAYDVTELVFARKDIERQEQMLLAGNEALERANKETKASMEELVTLTAELNEVRQKLLVFNTNLEQQVGARTRELELAKKVRVAQRERLARFFTQSPIGICILDGPQFTFEMVNPAYQQLFPGRHLTGYSLVQALPELKDKAILDILKDVYRTGKPFEGNRHHVLQVLTENDLIEERYFNFIYQARYNDKGNIDGILVFAFEVTAMVRVEKRLKEEQKKKDEFLSIASHELKTQLTSIQAFNQLMDQTNDLAKHRSFIHKSAESIWRLNKLINDLLDVTRINSGKMQYNMEEFSFDEMLKQTIENMQLVTKSHKLVFKKNEPARFYGDKIRLEQVISNFLNNAVKYSPTKEWVVINSVVSNNEILVSVQDFGIGIAATDLQYIAERYYRVDNAKMRFEGLGLGLFISADILKKHEGKFWIESEPGKGSTFYFSLPLITSAL